MSNGVADLTLVDIGSHNILTGYKSKGHIYKIALDGVSYIYMQSDHLQNVVDEIFVFDYSTSDTIYYVINRTMHNFDFSKANKILVMKPIVGVEFVAVFDKISVHVKVNE